MMGAVGDLVAWLREQLDEDERGARNAPVDPIGAVVAGLEAEGHAANAEGAPGWEQLLWAATYVKERTPQPVLHDPARVSREVEAKRRIVGEHEPEWRTVEWPHDQNGKGEAQVCRRCQNAEYTEWDAAPGKADVLPEGFIAPYVIAPCMTLRLLALPYADHPDYRQEWAP